MMAAKVAAAGSTFAASILATFAVKQSRILIRTVKAKAGSGQGVAPKRRRSTQLEALLL
jgi:hypothetical protein